MKASKRNFLNSTAILTSPVASRGTVLPQDSFPRSLVASRPDLSPDTQRCFGASSTRRTRASLQPPPCLPGRCPRAASGEKEQRWGCARPPQILPGGASWERLLFPTSACRRASTLLVTKARGAAGISPPGWIGSHYTEHHLPLGVLVAKGGESQHGEPQKVKQRSLP